MSEFKNELLKLDSTDPEWMGLVPLMEEHYDLMVRWNPVHNLTRDIAPKRAAMLHYRDSFLGLCLLREHLETLPSSIYDVGSGAGFPAIFLPHFFQRAEISWVEKVAKKASFLRMVVGALGLKVEVLQTNVFDAPKVDLVITRATFPWKKLVALSKVARGCVGFVATEPASNMWKEHVEAEGLSSFFQSYTLEEHQRSLACFENNVPRGTLFLKD